jgi:ribulose-5-phosphate 4-epimerase/fuculose-1-phosphate aldolase
MGSRHLSERKISDLEWELRRKLAIMCRIVGMQGGIGLYGHISIRVPNSDIVLITPGAGTEKTGVRIDQIFVFDLAGKIIHHPGGDRPMQIPAEWRIHTQIHKDRPELGCVAHLHAHASTLLGIAGRDIVGVFAQGSIIESAIPTYDNPLMILDDASAVALSKTLGSQIACQMRGHGSVVVGETAESALAACTFIEQNAQYQIEAATLGGHKPFPPEIWQPLVAGRRAGGGAGRLVWEYWERKVVVEGLPL